MGKRGHKTARRGQNWGRARTERQDPHEVERTNKLFERYYNELKIVGDDERHKFWEALRTDLPNSFRFTGSRGHALAVQQRLMERHIPKIESIVYDGENASPPEAIPWYPDRLAWSMNTPRRVVRKYPPFASFQKFLVAENSVGNISRQEIVSMIPPLFMDIKPGMTVLDLCAAPGSKAAQLIEMIHGGEEARVRKVLENVPPNDRRPLDSAGLEIDAEKSQASVEEDYADDGRATGLLVANDKEWKRANLLIHQCKRLNSPNIIVTNHDATVFPSLKLRGLGEKYLKFDRVLADVPCSGDGTCRKNLNVWRDWTGGNGVGLHPTQLRILIRALQMLKVGGKVVYSTCSMNPVENEAVIASAIEHCGGPDIVKLAQTDDSLPSLQRRPGLTDWKVADRDGRFWSSWEEAKEANKDGSDLTLSRLRESMFCNKFTSVPLNHCMRYYPHLQDTGAFFVAVLEKQTEIRATTQNTTSAHKSSKSSDQVQQPPQIPSSSTDLEHAEKGEDLPIHDLAPANGEMNANSSASALKRPLDGADEMETEAFKRPRTDDNIRSAEGRAESRQMGETRSSNGPPEEVFKYLSPEHPALVDIYRFYDVSARFPKDRFMVRNATGEPVKAIYYTSELARDILVENEGRKVKFVHAGVKMFMKQEVHGREESCKFRIQNEGLPIIEPWLGSSRVLRLRDQGTLHKLLKEMFPKIIDDEWTALRDIGEPLRDLSLGCCIVVVEPDGTANGFLERLVMPLWRGLKSVNLMLPKEDRSAMLLRLFDDDSPVVNTAIDLHQNRKEASFKRPESPNQTPLNDSKPEVSEEENGSGSLVDAIAVEQKLEEKEDAVLSGKQAAMDSKEEAAPGVADEDDNFNKTI
ncbi:MAG: hypothetical protein M1831_001870 [Alyxoria varia]|nr:MAG: hypothetical protein M1831_001870 [Alyxoria varia]